MRSWHRIVATPGQGMASANPLDAHPGTAEPAVLLDRFVSVLGAGGPVAAGRPEQGRDGDLVDADQEQDGPLHRRIRRPRTAAISRASTEAGASTAAGRPISTTS